MADIKQAATWLRQGKLVHRTSWRNTDFYLQGAGPNYEGEICGYDASDDKYDGDPCFAPVDLEAIDWEIYESA